MGMVDPAVAIAGNGNHLLSDGRWCGVPRDVPPVPVAQCSGFSRLADRGDILWIRGEGSGRTMTKVDAKDILDDPRKDPVLSPGDIIYVTERFL